MTNVTNSTMDSIAEVVTGYDPEDQGLVIMSWVLLGTFFGFFFGVVGIDMVAKHRSGELGDDMRGLGDGLVLMLRAIPMVFGTLYAKIASLVPRKEVGLDEINAEAATENTRKSQAVVERLAAKAPSANTTLSIGSFGSNLGSSN